MHLAIDLIHDTRHLCMRSRNDGIKAMSWGFSGGRQEKKSCRWKKSRLSLFIQGNRKLPPFILKDDNVKIWVEVIIVSFLYAVATLDVLMANSNDVNLAKHDRYIFGSCSRCSEEKSPLVPNPDSKQWHVIVFCDQSGKTLRAAPTQLTFWMTMKTNSTAITRIGRVYHLFSSWHTSWHRFYPIDPRARAKMAGIVNNVYCFWDRCLRRAAQLLANFFSVPELFAKVNSTQFLFRF